MLRKILICILLSPCMFIISQAQSTKSNELYAKGVEAYRTGNYDEAISFFSMVDSIDAADKLAAPRGRNARCWISSALYMKGDKPAARKADRYHYPLPPVDRRITAVIDSMYERFAGLTFLFTRREAGHAQRQHCLNVYRPYFEYVAREREI